MNTRLKIGNRLLNSDDIIAALVQYKLLESLIGHILLDGILQQVPLSKQELFSALVGGTNSPVPEDFEGFLTQWCQQQGITPTYFNSVLLRELRVQKFKQLQFTHQVESEFLRAKSDFDQVEYSLIQLTDLSFAQEIYFHLRDDAADFTQLAQCYSLGPERQTGGWIGPVAMSTLPVEIAELLRRGHSGDVFGPVPIANRYWIVRLEQLNLVRLTETMRVQLVDRLYTRWLQAQIKTCIAAPGMIAVQPGALAAAEAAAS